MSNEIVKGLPQHCAVKYGDSFVVQLQINNTYEIDGVSFTPTYASGGQVAVESLDNIFVKSRPQLFIEHYEGPEGTKYSIEEFQDAQKEMSQYVDEDDEYCFPDLDTEFEVRKRLEPILQTRAVYGEVPAQKAKLEIELIGGLEETGSAFIETPYVIGRTSFSGGGIYKVRTGQVARDALQQFAKDFGLEFTNSNHSHLEYAKLGGEYAVTSLKSRPYIRQGNASVCTDTLEAAHKVEEDIRKFLTDHLKMQFTEKLVKDLKVSALYSKLDRISREVSVLDVKQRNTSSHRAVMILIRELLEEIREATDE